jgi:DUF971 family protein
MSNPQLVPVSLKGDDRALSIQWSDGATHTVSWKTLRDMCPCATCRAQRAAPPLSLPHAGGERGGPLLPVLKPQEAQPVRANAMRPVGNYAYAIAFNDGHNTGIYSLELLRELGEAAAQEVSKSADQPDQLHSRDEDASRRV